MAANAIMAPRRYIFLVLLVFVVLSLHFFLRVSNMDYGALPLKSPFHVSSSSNLSISSAIGQYKPSPDPDGRRANATFVFLCRNDDLDGVLASVQSMEDRFNRKFHYPWVFLNDEPFTEDFQQRVTLMTDSPVSFGLIPQEHWVQPDWIDENRARRGRQHLMNQRIIYGGSVPYRNMCRFNSGFFFKHPLLQAYRYYWRVEPSVRFFCDLDYDPFLYMEEHDKIYSFTIALEEHRETVKTLWDSVKEFVAENPHLVNPENAMDFLSNDGGEQYNMCHSIWTFGAAKPIQNSLNFWTAKGGWYYERWGDAPVHSIAASLFARKDQTHFFRDIGYKHDRFGHCPGGAQWTAGRCACNPNDAFDYSAGSCLNRFEALFGVPIQ
ncbi:glycosyltransferase family 15 protein [Roridomyces roridus]|uniref:Glycosyltransferase family 15 protein n=1 Tax=Roridomyces roridus TaxID=1738132 RepID=A0AAD7BWS3_9AGAR|nr:glycosyltransferase family 15 protein [Roridomyces roridus]